MGRRWKNRYIKENTTLNGMTVEKWVLERKHNIEWDDGGKIGTLKKTQH